MKIVVESWLFVPHSYGVVSQFLLLDLRKRPELDVRYQPISHGLTDYRSPHSGLWDATTEATLRSLPIATSAENADIRLRICAPMQLAPGNARCTYLFGTTELGRVQRHHLKDCTSPNPTPHLLPGTAIVTTSAWSRAGFLRSGVPSDRLFIVPLGIDPEMHHPLQSDARRSLRQEFGWDRDFVFLNVGGMTNNKGINPLLVAFATLARTYPQARLVLKGSEAIYRSRAKIAASVEFLAQKGILRADDLVRLSSRMTYIGEDVGFRTMAKFYQAADAYVSPYLGEGFNLPVLEAIACGLPAICTAGGPTDDFTHPDFTLPVNSKLEAIARDGEDLWRLRPDQEHLVAQMSAAIAHPDFGAQARLCGPRFAAAHFTWRCAGDRLLKIFQTALSA